MSTASEYSDVEYVFEPHSRAMPDLRAYLAALWNRRDFMHALARSDLRTLRSNTTLGNLWGVLDPLFQAGIYFFLYSILRGGSRMAFLPILIADIFLFQLTTAALGEGGLSIGRIHPVHADRPRNRTGTGVGRNWRSLCDMQPRSGTPGSSAERKFHRSCRHQ
jgi:hypothetical protein